jgi:hypothetical protein
MQKIEPKKVVTLGTGEKYLVVAGASKEGQDYYYIAETNLEDTEMKENYKIVKATYEDDNIYLDEVVGENNLKSVLPLFIK